jgi:hypothetical protein
LLPPLDRRTGLRSDHIAGDSYANSTTGCRPN